MIFTYFYFSIIELIILNNIIEKHTFTRKGSRKMRRENKARERSSSSNQWVKRRPSIFVEGLGKDCAPKDLREKFYKFVIIVNIHILGSIESVEVSLLYDLRTRRMLLIF